MPYVLSRLIYNVSGKGAMRVGAREEAQRRELGARPPLRPATFDRPGGKPRPRGEKPRSHVIRMPDAARVQREEKLSPSPSRPTPGVVLMDYCFSF